MKPTLSEHKSFIVCQPRKLYTCMIACWKALIYIYPMMRGVRYQLLAVIHHCKLRGASYAFLASCEEYPMHSSQVARSIRCIPRKLRGVSDAFLASCEEYPMHSSQLARSISCIPRKLRGSSSVFLATCEDHPMHSSQLRGLSPMLLAHNCIHV
jgi:hypothetical protein